MKKYKTLIVDDEKLAREDLIEMLKAFPAIDIKDEASSVEEAVKFLKNSDLDLVFLDIQMPEQSGFELIPHLSKDTEVIFVTAFDEYAIKAFEVNAQDYLLKPVSTKRIETAIENLEQRNHRIEYPHEKLSDKDSVFVMINNAFQFIKIDSIIKITSAGNYTELITSTGHKGLVLKTMKEWEERLPESSFVRIHRNSIVNLKFVSRLKENINSSYLVYLEGIKEPSEMSRRYVAKLKESMR